MSAQTRFCRDFLCQFLLEFPQRRTGKAARWLAVCSQIALVLGAFLFFAALTRSVATNQPLWPLPAKLLNRSIDNRAYWMPFLGFCLTVTGIGFIGHRGWLPEDRRRGNRLLTVAALLILPFAVEATGTFLAELIPSLRPNAFRGIPLL